MYDPEKSLAAERSSQATWSHYQDVVGKLGEDHNYTQWFETIARSCDVLDKLSEDIRNSFDPDEREKLSQEFENLSSLIGKAIREEELHRQKKQNDNVGKQENG